MLGSSMNAAMTMLLTVAAAQIIDAQASGILSLAFGIGSIFGCISAFEVRAYQATDRNNRFSFGEYLGVRCATCLAGVFLSVGYIWMRGYGADKAQVVLWICLFKICEALSDVFQGLFQARDFIEYSGKSMFFRTLSASVFYTVVLWITRSVAAASLSMPLVSIAFLLMYDCRIARRFESQIRIQFSIAAVKGIFKECWPLAASAVMGMYVVNVEKLMIDQYDPQLQAVWAALFMPAAFINLFAQFAFKPMLTGMTDLWNGGKKGEFKRLCTKLCAGIGLLDLFVIVAGCLIGLPMLEVLYSIELSAYMGQFAVILLGGGFNALAVFLWYILVMIRKQKLMTLGDISAFMLAVLIVPSLVRRFAVTGAAAGYLLSMLIRAIVFESCVLYYVYRKRK